MHARASGMRDTTHTAFINRNSLTCARGLETLSFPVSYIRRRSYTRHNTAVRYGTRDSTHKLYSCRSRISPDSSRRPSIETVWSRRMVSSGLTRSPYTVRSECATASAESDPQIVGSDPPHRNRTADSVWMPSIERSLCSVSFLHRRVKISPFHGVLTERETSRHLATAVQKIQHLRPVQHVCGGMRMLPCTHATANPR